MIPSASMASVVVATPDVVGERMAGPGIRSWHFAHELARRFPTTLLASVPEPVAAPGGIRILDRQSTEARRALREADVLIGQPARGFRKRRRGQKVAFDLFDPTVLELRELYGNAPSLRQRIHLAAEWTRLAEALGTADLLIAAAPQQRAFYRQLQSCDAPWIDVPFGIDPAEAAVCSKPQDNVVIWGGGIWEWLDPKLAVDAVVRLNRDGVRCRLLFLGRTHPNRNVVDRRRSDRFDQLIASGGEHVAANPEWVPYRERLSWLRAGKIAIMLHRPTAEAEYAIRTRLFDAIAAGIPVVATSGGFAADLVSREGLGIVVPPEDLESVSLAIKKLLTDDVFYSASVHNIERVRPRFAWDVVTQPLADAVTEWLSAR